MGTTTLQRHNVNKLILIGVTEADAICRIDTTHPGFVAVSPRTAQIYSRYYGETQDVSTRTYLYMQLDGILIECV